MFEHFFVFHQNKLSLMFFATRGNDHWSNKSSLYGWDIKWFRQLHYFPDCYLCETSSKHNRIHHFAITSSAGTRDLWPFWWHYLNGRREDCIPRASQKCSSVLRALWFSMPTTKKHSRFPPRSMHLSLKQKHVSTFSLN